MVIHGRVQEEEDGQLLNGQLVADLHFMQNYRNNTANVFKEMHEGGEEQQALETIKQAAKDQMLNRWLIVSNVLAFVVHPWGEEEEDNLSIRGALAEIR